MRKGKNNVLYLTRNIQSLASASYANTKKRTLAMQRAGYCVTVFVQSQNSLFYDLIRLIAIVKRYDYLVMRIDGSEKLDIFTILKVFMNYLV